MRLFVAVDTGDSAGVAPAHITIAFLGEVPEEGLPTIEAALHYVAAHSTPFNATLDRLGAFPSAQNPRVVWQGVSTGATSLELLADRTRTALRDLAPGMTGEPFVPHVTLLRVRTPKDRMRARGLLVGAVPPPPPRTFDVNGLSLKSSRLTPAGAIHRTLTEFRFGN